MNAQMTRGISSPSSSTIGFATLTLGISGAGDAIGAAARPEGMPREAAKLGRGERQARPVGSVLRTPGDVVRAGPGGAANLGARGPSSGRQGTWFGRGPVGRRTLAPGVRPPDARGRGSGGARWG